MGQKKKITYPYEGQNVKACKFCPGVMIFWKKMLSGRYMPVERESLEPHWGNCPGASAVRRRE